MTILPTELESQLAAVAPAGVQYAAKTDAKGVCTAWCTLADKDDLLPVASLVKELGGRLSTTTVLQPKGPNLPAPKEGEPAPVYPNYFGDRVPRDGKSYEINYHFDVEGDTLTLIIHVPAGGEVDSLTPLYRAADWPEREAMELYGLAVRGHPDPRRLFIDPAIDGAVFERLIPYSTLVNSASTKGLWEKILALKGTQS